MEVVAVPVALAKVIFTCQQVYQQWQAAHGLHKWFAVFLNYISIALTEVKDQGRSPPRALSIVDGIQRLVDRGRQKLEKYGLRWEVTRMLVTARREEGTLREIQCQLSDLVGVLQLCCRQVPIALASTAHTALSPADPDANPVHQHAVQFQAAVAATTDPATSEYQLETALAGLQASALDLQLASGASKRWQAVLKAIRTTVHKATGQAIGATVAVHPMQDEWRTPASPAKDTATALPSEEEARTQLMNGKGNDLLLFSCPRTKLIFEMEGDAQPVRMRPCRCVVSMRAAMDGGTGQCSLCEKPLAVPSFRKDKRMLRIVQTRNEVVTVPKEQVKLKDYIAHGGQGVVFQGILDSKRVAIKCIQVDYGNLRSLRSAWKGIAVAHLASSCSPQVNVLLGVTWQDTNVGFILEHCDGKLTNAVARAASQRAGPCGGLPDADIALLLLELVTACAALHVRARIVHGDIKPDNVLLRDGRPCLIDFGIASILDTHVTTANAAHKAGTVGYAAPEQGEGQPTVLMDVYSIGATVVFAAQNTAPYGNLNAIGIAKRHMQKDAIPVPKRLPKQLHALLQRMVQLDAAARPTLEEVQREAAALLQEFSAASPPAFLQPTYPITSPPAAAALQHQPTFVVDIREALKLGSPQVPKEAVDGVNSSKGPQSASLAAQVPHRKKLAKRGRSIKPTLVLKGHSGPVISVAWSPDGAQLATTSLDNTVVVWDAASGSHVVQVKRHSDKVYGVAWSPDGALLATTSLDNTAAVCYAASGSRVAQLKGHTNFVTSVAWSPDGAQLATASYDNTAAVWDAASGSRVVQLEGHSDCVVSVAWSPDGAQLATASLDNTAAVWDAASGTCVLQLEGHSLPVNSVAWSPDGAQLATASYDNTAAVWHAASGNRVVQLKGHSNYVISVAWSPDGAQLATASCDNTAAVWDAASGSCVVQLEGHSDCVISVAWSPDGAQLATASYDNTAVVWDAASGSRAVQLEGHNNGVINLAWSPDGAQLATASWDETAAMWTLCV